MRQLITAVVRLASLLCLQLLASLAAPGLLAQERLYVAPGGNDAWSGRLAQPAPDGSDGPLATLHGARQAIRGVIRQHGLPPGGVIVELAAGEYRLAEPLALGREDSGAAEAPIVYRAADDAEVRLTGGRKVTSWETVAEPALLARLDPQARGRVLQADVGSLANDELGSVAQGGAELYFDDRPAKLARWPNEGFANIREITKEAPATVHGRSGSKVGKFHYDGQRPERWIGEHDLWLHGYWFWDWSDEYQRVASIDRDRQLIELAPPYHGYGYLRGARYCALNALAELDEPGEWQLDRRSKKLYFWPPGPIDGGRPTLSVADELITAKQVKHVTFEGLVLECVRGTAVQIVDGDAVRVVNCTVRNTGGGGVTISESRNCAVVGCDVYNTAAGGVSLSGGDRSTLTPGRNLAEGNRIHHYGRWKRTYTPGVSIAGVGNLVRHNLFHDAPHNAVQLSGNDHLIEFNEFHHVCLETDDVGAFYMGRDWTQRGNVVRYNYFHHLGRHGGGIGVMAIYLDDWASGATVYGNVCYQAGRAVLIGGGRDNTIENNVFVDCSPSVHVDSRGLGWASSYFDGSDTTLVDRLNAVDFRRPPWSERYPQLLSLYDDEPAIAKGNRIVRNISWGGRWLDLLDGLTEDVVAVNDNLVGVDPQFWEPGRDFRIRESSPAFALGFKQIPFEQIGLPAGASHGSAPEPEDAAADALRP
ncbi:MAG: hypothetical protein DCC67_10870 [Planctomycetota bacterium]|nr:MAG: hypothetical protein DCC67_10870 [Planctomycetota bacterium]